MLIHATAVAIETELGFRALLLRGRSGSGKSDLALRLIDAGARLVTDDQSVLSRRDDMIIVGPPARISGLLEVRGIGIMRVEALAEAPVVLIADLVSPDQREIVHCTVRRPAAKLPGSSGIQPARSSRSSAWPR